MGKFLEEEKISQTEFKRKSPYFSEEARADGYYKGKPRPFCLPLAYAEQNLFPEIQESTLEFFQKNRIKWHDGNNGKPSNHLCSSQVCCVNFLFPLGDSPDSLRKIFSRIYPDIEKMLPIENGRYVSFEWIGAENYLGEKKAAYRSRTRGQNFTSADAAVMFERKNGKRQIVLIEWKYTESYGSTNLKYSRSGTDRTAIYRHLYDREDCPINYEVLPDFDALFYEPFYQFMRQQLLANEMEKAGEMGVDVVSVLHIAPTANQDFQKVTSPLLTGISNSAVEVWKKLMKADDRFLSVSTEHLFESLSSDQLPDIKPWIRYIHERYHKLV
jgi:hypothetical protein